MDPSPHSDAADDPPPTTRRAFLTGLGAGGLGVGAALNADRLAALSPADEGDGHGHGDADAVRALVADEAVTHRATGGRWRAASTWAEDVPDDGARVLVPEGTTVTLGHEATARHHTVRVDGRLRVDSDAVARLAVDTLVVTATGTLELGRDDAPVTASTTVEFLDRGPIDESWDPERIGRGLVTLAGATIRMAGAETTPFAETARHPEAGDRTLALADAPTGWSAGDRVVVAGLHPDRNEDEERRVAGVSGSTVRLDAPLEFDHVPPRDSFSAYVLHRDRRVRLRSESERTKRRGHVMFMGGDVAVSGVAFEALGRTDKSRPFTDPTNGVPPADAPPNPQARYACHFHRTGTSPDAARPTVEGCHVDGSPGWGYVNHASRVRFADNTAYRVFGAAFVAEAGPEAGTFHHNFALRSHGSGDVPDGRQFAAGREGNVDDFGHGGYGFWFQGPDLTVTENVAAGHRHHGFVYWNRAKPEREVPPDELRSLVGGVPNVGVERLDGQSELADSDRVEDGKVPSSFVRVREFADNTVFASGGGLDVSRHMFTAAHDRVDAYSVVDRFTAFNVGSHRSQWDRRRPPNDRGAQGGTNGVSVRYSANVVLREPTLVAGAGEARGVGVNRNHAVANVHVERPDIEGWHVGIRAPPRGSAPVSGGRLDNEVDVQVVGGTTDRRWTPAQRVALEGVNFGDGGRTELFASAELQDDLYGLFTPEGSVTRDGERVYFAEQAPEFTPVPTADDLPDTDEDPLGDLTDVPLAALVGESNATLAREYGLAVEGEVGPELARAPPAGIETGRAEAGPIEFVSSAAGALFEVGRLAQGERVTVYGDAEFRTVPGRYAGLPYVRFDEEHAAMDRPSWLLLGLSTRSDVFVAYGGESLPAWLGDWTDTGRALGATDGVRTVVRRTLDAGRHWLGGVPDSAGPYVVFARER